MFRAGREDGGRETSSDFVCLRLVAHTLSRGCLRPRGGGGSARKIFLRPTAPGLRAARTRAPLLATRTRTVNLGQHFKERGIKMRLTEMVNCAG